MGCCSSKPIPPNPNEIDLTHFDLLKVVGKGGFGKVNAITKLDSGELLALKRMEKYAVLQSSSHLKMVWIERKIMSLTNSPFLCNLLYAFESDKELFLVMPFMQGGDLRFHLKERGTMPVSTCQFYACEMILGLAALHEKKVVFRDLKPDNMLLDAQGHLRISDFGLACILEERNNYQTTGQAGTRGYQSPEVITDQWYGCEVDIWSFGVTVYELLHGVRPWKDWTRLQQAAGQHQQQQAAAAAAAAAAQQSPNGNAVGDQNGHVSPDGSPVGDDKASSESKEGTVRNMRSIHISSKLDAVTADFLTRILHVDKKKRLGCGPGGWEEVKSHPWFANIDWEKIARKEITPPITPDLTRANCFPEKDTRILTDQGFRFLHQLMPHASPSSSEPTSTLSPIVQRRTLSGIKVASYDPKCGTLSYTNDCTLLIKSPSGAIPLIDFTQQDERTRWEANTNTSHSHAHITHQHPHRHPTNHGISLRVTTDHDMYVQRGMKGSQQSHQLCMTKVRAEKMLEETTCSHTCPLDGSCKHRRTYYRLMTAPTGGIGDNESDEVVDMLMKRLGLTSKQVHPFLQLLGYRIGADTTTTRTTCCRVRTSHALRFCTNGVVDEEKWVVTRLNSAGLLRGRDYNVSACASGTAGCYSVTKSSWLNFFDDEDFPPSMPQQSKSAKLFPAWVKKCSQSQVRLLIDGVSRANHAEQDWTQDEKAVYTSSVAFRDELVHMCLHAGYTSSFDRHHPGGDDKLTADNTLATGSWRVSYAQPSCSNSNSTDNAMMMPTRTANDITTTMYEGKVWCVTVPSGLIVAQRASLNEETGLVTQTSTPMIVGNCTADADLADQLLDRKPREIPPDQQQHFRGWKFRTEINKPDLAAHNPMNHTGSSATTIHPQTSSSSPNHHHVRSPSTHKRANSNNNKHHRHTSSQQQLQQQQQQQQTPQIKNTTTSNGVIVQEKQKSKSNVMQQ